MTYLSHLLIKQTLQILLNERITGFTLLKPKHHWDLMLKMVFRRNLLYFMSLIMFMDGLYLDNDFRTRFLKFLLFLLLFFFFCCCWWGCFVGPVVVASDFVSLFYYYYYYYYYYCYYYYYYYHHFKIFSYSLWLC